MQSRRRGVCVWFACAYASFCVDDHPTEDGAPGHSISLDNWAARAGWRCFNAAPQLQEGSVCQERRLRLRVICLERRFHSFPNQRGRPMRLA